MHRLLLVLLIAALVAGGLLALNASSPVRASNPLASARRLAPTPIEGQVREAVRAGSYTYMAIAVADDAAPAWVVVMGRGAAPGQPVRLTRWASYDTFNSPRLGRTFAPLYLATMR